MEGLPSGSPSSFSTQSVSRVHLAAFDRPGVAVDDEFEMVADRIGPLDEPIAVDCRIDILNVHDAVLMGDKFGLGLGYRRLRKRPRPLRERCCRSEHERAEEREMR